MFYFLSLSAYLTLLWLFGLNELFIPGHVLVPHDTFYPINDYLNTTAFATFNSAFNYSNNLPGLMVLAPDAIAIFILKLIFSNNEAQLIHIALCLLIFFSLSFVSINYIFRRPPYSALLTFCYCFSPFSSIFYSAGIIYQISTAIGLGVLPILVFKLMNFKYKKDALLVILLIFLLAYGLLFIYPALLLTCFTLLLLWYKHKAMYFRKFLEELRSPKKIALLLICLLPLAIFVYLVTTVGSDKGSYLENGTSSAIQGGIFYPLMQISAWGLYNLWSPRAILSFHSYFFENPYRLLSILLFSFISYYLYKNKKYTPLYFILFLAFFAKGPNPPLGSLFTLIINYFPFGYMIRTPDTKFGAFIAAWFIVSMYFLAPKQRLIASILAALFLISNLFGIFQHGAISSIRGDERTTTFIKDSESTNLTNFINKQSNSVVIANFEPCAEELYENRLHTCHGLIATSINRQLIHAQGRSLDAIAEIFEPFPLLIMVNKRLKNNKPISKKLLAHSSLLYDSENYSLYYKNPVNKVCEGSHHFGCVYLGDSTLISIPEAAYKHYYNQPYTKTQSGFVLTSNEPKESKDMMRLLLLFLCGLSYTLIAYFIICIYKKNRF